MDVRPQMARLRFDSHVISAGLERGDLEPLVSVARRFEGLALARGSAAVPAQFLRFEQALREQAGALVRALDRGDRGASQAAYQELLQRCSACHAMYRYGGAAPALLR